MECLINSRCKNVTLPILLGCGEGERSRNYLREN